MFAPSGAGKCAVLDRLIETLKTGHDAIDEDHVLVVTPLREAWTITHNKGDPSMAQACLERFFRLCEGHFHREETILAHAGYPDTDRHASFHREVLRQIRETKTCFATAETWDERIRCLERLAALMIDDLVKGDLTFVSFLQAKGLAEERY